QTDGSEVRTGAGVAGPVSAKPAAQSFERTFADMEPVGAGQLAAEPAQPQSTQVMPDAAGEAASANASAIELEPAVSARGDGAARRKTVMPKIAAGGYKLPPSSLLHRPDDQHDVNEEEVKAQAEVLTEKCAEFDVLGAVTQINPGPVVTTYEFKPEPGVKYSRVTGLSEDLCLAMRAESILIERMAGKSTVGIQVPNHQ